MFCVLLTSRYQVSVYRTNGPLVVTFLQFELSHFWAQLLLKLMDIRYLVSATPPTILSQSF